ncbi:MAG TPA: chemotaxis protein CheA [Acidocella sp.]|nr:chemotaxis protein CheA [Acidocella sp.]
MDQMAAIRATFFQECEEQLGELESGLIKMESGTQSVDTVNAVFRAVHSIKGGAGIFGLDSLVRFAHAFETTLDGVRCARLAPTPEVMATLLRAADLLADLVAAARDSLPFSEDKTGTLISALEQLNRTSATQQMPPPHDTDEKLSFAKLPTQIWSINFRPKRELYAKANEAALLLRELHRLGNVTVVIDTSQLPELSQIDVDGAYLSWMITLTSDCTESAIHDVFEFVDGDCLLEIASIPIAMKADEPPEFFEGFEFFKPMDMVTSTTPLPLEKIEVIAKSENLTSKVDAGSAATIRVDLERVDRMIDLVGELVINEAMLSQRVLEAGIVRASGVSVALEELEHLTREIQDSVMAIRAQPVRSVFQRMPRLVREVAAQTGKQVRLLTEGEGTEVDKTVIERIADPLTHMIRNAIDHGLELPEMRLAAGKPVEGVVRLAALHRSGRIVVEVADDGAGIDRSRVRAKAEENGLISGDASLSDDEIDNLIFLPGFSTASAVTDISGRGVGMDVVRRSVQALGGRISISSRPGRGSTFTMSLPLTLAVLDGMVVNVATHSLIVPLGAILETLQPRAQDVHPLDRKVRVLSLRGSYVPMVDVALALGYRSESIEPTKSVALLVECEGGSQAVLLFDTIQGQRQVVIKSLEANYRAVPGIAAATVMGDGRVALILDVDAIVAASRAEQPRGEIVRTDLTLLEAN